MRFFLGLTIISTPIILGRSYVFYFFILALSIIMTMLWRRAPRPWISLVSISAATPIALFVQQVTCNLMFAFWFVLFNMRYLFRLPKWIYFISCLAMLGVITSSINWISGDAIRGIMRQGIFAYNLFLGPFLLLPVVYIRMRGSRDHAANLKVLLFFLILPSTTLLLATKLFGTVANAWEASRHISMLPDGFLQYRLGNVLVNFLRTEIGFILATLVCASTAIVVSQVKGIYRFWATACLLVNVFLLLSTGSFGSSLACFAGLTAIFYTQFRQISGAKVMVSLTIICSLLILSFVFAPASTKQYLEKRYEHRVVNADTDRVLLWGKAIDQIIKHPEGVGLTFSVGSGANKSFIHNDYLTYTVSYGLLGGLAYTSLIIGLLLSFLRIRRSLTNDPAALAVYLAGLGVIVTLALNGMTDHSNENRWYFNVIWSIIWYCYFCSSPEKNHARLGDDS